MVPVLFMVVFAIIEFAFWFGASHYDTYAAFAGARAQQVGGSASSAAGALLDGNVTRDATVSADASMGTVTIDQPWTPDLPFTSSLGDMAFDVTVVAGPDEEKYEGRTGNRAVRYADNNCLGSC